MENGTTRGGDVRGSRLVEEILAYCGAHPDAQDTLQGVMEWWLFHQQISTGMSEVKAALDELVEEGVLIEHRGPDSQIRYAVDRRRLQEVRDLPGRTSETPATRGSDPSSRD